MAESWPFASWVWQFPPPFPLLPFTFICFIWVSWVESIQKAQACKLAVGSSRKYPPLSVVPARAAIPTSAHGPHCTDTAGRPGEMGFNSWVFWFGVFDLETLPETGRGNVSFPTDLLAKSPQNCVSIFKALQRSTICGVAKGRRIEIQGISIFWVYPRPTVFEDKKKGSWDSYSTRHEYPRPIPSSHLRWTFKATGTWVVVSKVFWDHFPLNPPISHHRLDRGDAMQRHPRMRWQSNSWPGSKKNLS